MYIRELEQDEDVWKRIRTIFKKQTYGRKSGGILRADQSEIRPANILCFFVLRPQSLWAVNSEKLKIAWETSHWPLRIDIVYKCNMLQFISNLSTEWLNYIYCIETLTTKVPNFVCEVRKFVAKFGSSYWNSQANLYTKSLIGPWSKRSQSNASFTNWFVVLIMNRLKFATNLRTSQRSSEDLWSKFREIDYNMSSKNTAKKLAKPKLSSTMLNKRTPIERSNISIID
jgi:hypothetical protein